MASLDTSADVSSAHQIDDILRAAAQHDLVKLRTYLDTYTFPDCAAVDVLEPDTNRCPLHLAVASCKSADDSFLQRKPDKCEAAEKIIQLLFEDGAIWNQLDSKNETPGCLARRLGLYDLYAYFVDAGVRAEMLLNRLEGYHQLNDEEDELQPGEDIPNVQLPVVMKATAEPEKTSDAVIAEQKNEEVDSKTYLSSALLFSGDKILDEQQNGVMMDWERGIMQRSVDAILDRSGLRLLNIGAGMLIFDSIAQASTSRPAEHHIIEAHPDVLRDMEAKGWLEKSGVIVHAGKWQDILPGLVADGETFDAIYFDTFAESYADFREFFQEQVIGLLNQSGKWSYFNGMGADRQISYDVYQKVVEMDLFESGFDVQWQDIELPQLHNSWEGVKRKYWNIDRYRLPVCKLMD